MFCGLFIFFMFFMWGPEVVRVNKNEKGYSTYIVDVLLVVDVFELKS